jgi:hypothetical protein
MAASFVGCLRVAPHDAASNLTVPDPAHRTRHTAPGETPARRRLVVDDVVEPARPAADRRDRVLEFGRAIHPESPIHRIEEAAVAKYLVLYRSKMTAAEQMAQSTPEQAKAGMDAWMAWAGRAGNAITDLGAPVNRVTDEGGGDPVGGFSIMEADSPGALQAVLAGHPHREMGGTIAVYEFLPMPGM